MTNPLPPLVLTAYELDQWLINTDFDWLCRPSLHEMQLDDAIETTYEVAVTKQRLTDSMHSLVTHGITLVLPSSKVSNAELLRVLFGTGYSKSSGDDKRPARHLRNEKRPLKIDRAAHYLRALMYARTIATADGGRLWYWALLYEAARFVVNQYLNDVKNPPPQLPPPQLASMDKAILLDQACEHFKKNIIKYVNESNALPLDGYPLNDVQQVMDYCALVQWQESRLKRNPMVGTLRMIEAADYFNAYEYPPSR